MTKDDSGIQPGEQLRMEDIACVVAIFFFFFYIAIIAERCEGKEQSFYNIGYYHIGYYPEIILLGFKKFNYLLIIFSMPFFYGYKVSYCMGAT